MPQDNKLPSLEELQRKLDAAAPHKSQESNPSGADTAQGMGILSRLAIDLLAGVVVGAGIGYALDHWLDTGPWLTVVCFFFGAGAGFVNMKRTAEQLDKQA